MTAKRLLLMLAVLTVLAASGVVWAAAALTTGTVVQMPVALIDPGTTWMADGITHLRGMVADTVCEWDYDGDGITDDVTIVEVTQNSVRDADGAGAAWGTWCEYDYDTRTVLLGSGSWEGKPTCWEYLAESGEVVGSAHVWGWRSMPNGDWAQLQVRFIVYAVPPYAVNIGEARFLVPGGE